MIKISADLIRDIKKKHAQLQLKTTNYYTILEVEKNSTLKEIRLSYRQLAKKYHQDRYTTSNLGAAENMIQDIFSAVSKAYSTLSNTDKRSEYDENLEAEKHVSASDLGNIFASESVFMKGKTVLSNGNYAGAYKLFVEACNLNPNEFEFSVYKSFTQFMKMKPESAEAIEYLGKAKSVLFDASKKYPENDEFLVFLAQVYKSEGDIQNSQKNFQKALKINPRNIEAAREIRLFKSRGTQNQKTSVFIKLISFFK